MTSVLLNQISQIDAHTVILFTYCRIGVVLFAAYVHLNATDDRQAQAITRK